MMRGKELHMYEEWKKNEPMIDDIPLEQYEELIMSCTSDLGMGVREELGKQYYYAFIMLYINGVKYCRYSLISKEEHDFGVREHEYCSEPDGITATNFYNKYILNHKIFYDGIYNPDILEHLLVEILQINEANNIKKTYQDDDYEKAYNVIVGKEFKYAKICMLLVSVLFFMPSTILMFLINASYDMIWLNLIWVFALSGETAAVVFYLWTVYQRKKFLSSSQIENYAGEIPGNIVKSTPTEIVTRSYIFKRQCPSNPIDLSQVEWVYRKRVTVGGQSSDHIVFRMRNGKKREMNHRVSFTESNVYHLIKKLNPEVMIGNSVDNYKRYKEILKKEK